MIDENENLLTLADAAKTIPNRLSRRGVNVSTVWRWSMKGVRGVVLETKLYGGIRYTSREALERFFTALTDASRGNSPIPTASSARRQREIEAAERRLDKVGVRTRWRRR